MMNNNLFAIVLIVVALVLFFFAYRSSQRLGDQFKEAVTGRYTDATIWFLIFGAVAAVSGIGLLLF
ncbi:DUF3185 family protein [Arsukibacterium sp.]|uniref:DUF3185 family protein n=1 Tax=Arsukibacterium sp. TaxID=1977258 RepID=UPI002FD8B6B3